MSIKDPRYNNMFYVIINSMMAKKQNITSCVSWRHRMCNIISTFDLMCVLWPPPSILASLSIATGCTHNLEAAGTSVEHWISRLYNSFTHIDEPKTEIKKSIHTHTHTCKPGMVAFTCLVYTSVKNRPTQPRF